MYICICNAITENDIIENPKLNDLVGTVCGMCLNYERRSDNRQVVKPRVECI